jgi:hypothetical protein
MQTTNPEKAPDGADLLSLGVALGQTQALNLVAGRCTAAQAGCLRLIRNEKLYLACTDNWDDFCASHLGISRAEANRMIHLLEEFGAGYFEVAQLVRISPATYRALAPSVKDGALHVDGEAIELTVENARRVSAAVAELRRGLPAPARKTANQPDRVADLDERARRMVADFEEFAAMERKSEDWPLFSATLTRTCSALRRIETEAA